MNMLDHIDVDFEMKMAWTAVFPLYLYTLSYHLIYLLK